MEDNRSAVATIYKETMRSDGFLSALRENRVDEYGFQRLMDAVEALRSSVGSERTIDKVAVACLFEVPWEIENTVPHYRQRDPDLGILVSRMADTARSKIMDLLWEGLEEFYENP